MSTNNERIQDLVVEHGQKVNELCELVDKLANTVGSRRLESALNEKWDREFSKSMTFYRWLPPIAGFLTALALLRFNAGKAPAVLGGLVVFGLTEVAGHEAAKELQHKDENVRQLFQH